MNMKTIKKLLIIVSMYLFASSLYAQEYNIDTTIEGYLEEAQYYFDKAGSYDDLYVAGQHYKLAISDYEGALKLLDYRVPDIYYQLCICYTCIDDFGGAQFYLDVYKRVNEDDIEGIKYLESAIAKKKNASKVPWGKYKLQGHITFKNIDYAYANFSFERRGRSYSASLQGVNFGYGFYPLVIEGGIYNFVEKDLWNVNTWCMSLGLGLRFIQPHPIFYVGDICFRYVGYAGINVWIFPDEKYDHWDSWAYKFTSGLFVSKGNIPRGIRFEIFYQKHGEIDEKHPLILNKPYFGLQIGFYGFQGREVKNR